MGRRINTQYKDSEKPRESLPRAIKNRKKRSRR
jgi:hypothetical protein